MPLALRGPIFGIYFGIKKALYPNLTFARHRERNAAVAPEQPRTPATHEQSTQTEKETRNIQTEKEKETRTGNI